MQLTLKNDTVYDDQSILNGLLNKVPASLKQLDRKYHGLLKSTIMNVLHNNAEADDVLQEVLLQIWERASTYSEEKGKLINWLCTLARRRAIDHIRQFSAYQRATDRYEQLQCSPEKESPQNNFVASEVHRDDLHQILVHHLKMLPSSQQQVVQMTYFEERTQREIAFMTKTPLGTVKTRLELGIKKLAISIGSLRYEIFNN